MDLTGKNIVVVGLARSGLAVARFLKARGARVTITDKAVESDLGSFLTSARELNVPMELGGHCLDTLLAAHMIVLSPGVPHTLEPFVQARRKGVRVIGEIELASRFIDVPIVAVSGTNGKTTTTELLGRMLTASGLKVFVGGNIGSPLIDVAGSGDGIEVVVAEISSFQLDTTENFRPHVAVLLNITPDHLDRYDGMAGYAASKGLLFRNQTQADIAICHGNDELVGQQCRNIESRLFKFYTSPPGNGKCRPCAVITPRQVVVFMPDEIPGRIDLSRTALIGPHNRENIAAATLAALLSGASLSGIQTALDEFPAMAHRLEHVGTVRGVRFVNDSKATNMDAVMRALECFERPVILIMGGRNKGYDFLFMQDHLRKYVRKLIVIGEAGPEILSDLGQAPSDGSEGAADMTQAVHQAYAVARDGDTVLLSPACASFDMFGSYVERGDTFRRLVGELS